jgi:hypothetical protein
MHLLPAGTKPVYVHQQDMTQSPGYRSISPFSSISIRAMRMMTGDKPNFSDKADTGVGTVLSNAPMSQITDDVSGNRGGMALNGPFFSLKDCTRR